MRASITGQAVTLALVIAGAVIGCGGSGQGKDGGAGSGGAPAAGADGQAGNGGAGIAGGGETAGAGTAGGGTAGGGGIATAGGSSGADAGGQGGASAGHGGASAGYGGGAPPPTGPLLGDVALSVPSQSFKGELSVGLSTTIPGAEIRYTTDGTLPTADAPLYGEPLTLSHTTQVRAQPFVAGAAAGRITTGLYIARTFDLTSALPIVLLDDYGQGPSTSKTTYIDAAIMIFEPRDGTASLTNLPTVAARAGFHLRGQSSARFDQKPYKIELRDNADADAKQAIAGMPADADWALIAPYYDRALVRNPFTYTLGREMGLAAPRTANVEVYLNLDSTARPVAETDYQGVYWFTETIKINGHRVDLADLKPDDTTPPEVTGGYIFKFDQLGTDPAAPHLTCTEAPDITCWTDCELTDPVPLPAPDAQLAYITGYVQSFHETLFAIPLGDYGAYIDVDGFVDYLIVSELTRNTDAYVRSAYFHKDKNGLLEGGPLWDYNFALGVGGQAAASATPLNDNDGGWQFQGATAGSLPRRNVSSWFPKLMTDPAFVEKVATRWRALRVGLLSDQELAARLDALAAQLPAASVARDAARWPVDAVFKPAMAGGGGFGIRVYGPTDPTWEGQVKALHDWILARAAWMDAQWP